MRCPLPAATPRAIARSRAAACATDFQVGRQPAEDARLRAVTPFHLAIPVHSLSDARAFYGGAMGLPEGRSSARWVDYNVRGRADATRLRFSNSWFAVLWAPAGMSRRGRVSGLDGKQRCGR